MARPSKYTAEQKAQVFAELTANEGNIKRTARNTTLPETTVRNWKKEWERKGVPAAVDAAVPAVLDDFMQKAERVRDVALDQMLAKIASGDAKVGELNAVVGTLTDKIRLIRGEATSRSESVNAGPTPEEFGMRLLDFVENISLAQAEREADIIDAEFEEQALPALPEQTS